jgi:hypothetical protein
MHRFVFTIVIALVAVLAAGPALAFQCPKLVKKIEDETALRYDEAAANAKVKAAEAAELHAKGKHAEAEKTAKDGLKLLGM